MPDHEAVAASPPETATLPPPQPAIKEMARAPDRNLALELVRVTEAAAMGAGRWVGRGDPEAARMAAIDAMRLMLSTVPMSGVVVVGEGERGRSPGLLAGEEVGDGQPPEVDVAGKAIDGTGLTSRGQGHALSVVAVAERGSMLDPGPAEYMMKLACGPEAAEAVDFEAPPEENVFRVARAKGVKPEDITVTMLARPRHVEMITRVRRSGARVFLITDGDVAGAINAARAGTGIDLLLGIGGTREAVLAACAMRCLEGELLARLAPQTDVERARVEEAGMDLTRVFTANDLVASNDVFFAATGVTDGRLLRGVRYQPGGAITDSMVMRSRSGTVRRIEAEHRFEKLMRFSGIEYQA